MKNYISVQLGKIHIFSQPKADVQVVLKLFQHVLYCRWQDVIIEVTSLTLYNPLDFFSWK